MSSYLPTCNRWTRSCKPKGTSTNPIPQGCHSIVYLFPAVLWLLHYPDLARNQLRPHIKRQMWAFGPFRSVQAALHHHPSRGSDLYLWTGDGSCRLRRRGGRSVRDLKCHPIAWNINGNQNADTARLSAVGCLESHGQENCARLVQVALIRSLFVFTTECCESWNIFSAFLIQQVLLSVWVWAHFCHIWDLSGLA